MELRKLLLLPLDDFLAVLHKFMTDQVPRLSLDYCFTLPGFALVSTCAIRLFALCSPITTPSRVCAQNTSHQQMTSNTGTTNTLISFIKIPIISQDLTFNQVSTVSGQD